jgi:glycerophosphoryl diester phosphodiesterase
VPEIQGHRGARALRPENTLPGLAHALEVGVDGLEFDVTRTADGGLILAHDLTVDPVTTSGTGPASAGDPQYPYVGKRWRDLTLAQVATLDAGDRRPPDPFEDSFVAVPGTGVPTLDQVCRLITEAGADRVILAVELKTRPSWPDADVRALTEAALEVLAAYDLTSRSRLLAFDWRVLTAAKAAAAAVPRVALLEPTTWAPGSAWLAGLDPEGYADSAAAARDIGASWLSPWDPMITASLVTSAHDAGLKVVAWTVNDEDRMAELTGLGADAIVSDRPDVLRQFLIERGDPVPPACALPELPDWAPRPAAA